MRFDPDSQSPQGSTSTSTPHDGSSPTEWPSGDDLVPEGLSRPGGLTREELTEAANAYLLGKAPKVTAKTFEAMSELLELRHSIEARLGRSVFESDRICL